VGKAALPLHEYFAASDFVLTQSGYGKVAELLALGVPFLAIPLDHHFEQESVMAHRLRHYGVGQVVTLRDHTPEAMATLAESMMVQRVPRILVDNGTEVADIILQATELDQSATVSQTSLSALPRS
jgi:UDP-N-acetylglucosamine:LPS N-acetylglucosamine transferase